MITETDAEKIIAIITSGTSSAVASESPERDIEEDADKEASGDTDSHTDSSDTSPLMASARAEVKSEEAHSKDRKDSRDDPDDEHPGGSVEGDEGDQRSDLDSGEVITDEYLPGFRMQFYDRYESLIKTAKKHYGLTDADFPDYRGPRYEDDKPSSPAENKTGEMISADIKNLETMLKGLTDTYHKLAEHEGNYESLEKVRMRIHDCKRKLHMLKNERKTKEK
ncbi:MAG: hypothetical protein ACLFTR_02645 [Candidatus Woesearchaeota archaeon]